MRMSEPDFAWLTAGVWRAADALEGAELVVGQWQRDASFGELIEELTRLPPCASFQPFAGASHWSVEIGGDNATKPVTQRRRTNQPPVSSTVKPLHRVTAQVPGRPTSATAPSSKALRARPSKSESSPEGN